MLFRNRCRHDFYGHMDTVCEEEASPAGCGDVEEPQHAGRRRRAHDCGRIECRRFDHGERPRAPRGTLGAADIILRFFFLVLIAALIWIAVFYAWRYGREVGIRVGELSVPISQTPVFAETPEGGPCRRWSDGYCREADDTQAAIQWARYYLRRGDAESALRDWDASRDFYRAAMDIGSSVGAQAAIFAAKRIQYQSMTCEYTDESLARISRDYNKNPLGALIEMRQKQQALKALGYYNGKVDNRHGAETRDGVRQFQDDLWFDQKGVLTAEQTVLLLCAAAHVAKDAPSQNVLGIMYAGGLGVRQNTDFALDWLEAAVQRGNHDASWNLALMYGTQTVLSSVQICDAVQNAERADSYLEEAARGGHPAAMQAIAKYPRDEPDTRWRKLAGDLNRPEAMDRVGRGCNPNN